MKPAIWALGISSALVAAGYLLLALVRPSSPGASAEVFAYHKPAASAQGLEKLWHVPRFSFKSQHARPTTDRDLKGRVWIADFIFTTCTTVCPISSAKMVLLQRRLPDKRLGFLSFSVDPEHDSPKVLRDYEKKWNPHEWRWLLLSTDQKGLQAAARGMRVAVEASDDKQNPIIHSSMFFLIDTGGEVRGVYDSADDTALHKLERDVQSLLGGEAAPVTKATGAEGRALYFGLGCAEDILCRIREFVAVGVTKFVLRPIGTDDEDLMVQTRSLIERLLPEIEAMRA